MQELKKTTGDKFVANAENIVLKIASFIINHPSFIEDYSTLTQFNKWLKKEVPAKWWRISISFYMLILHITNAMKERMDKKDEEKNEKKAKKEFERQCKAVDILTGEIDTSNFCFSLLADIVGAFQQNKLYKVTRVCAFMRNYNNLFLASFNGELARWIKINVQELKEITKLESELGTFSSSFVRLLKMAKDTRLNNDDYRQKAVKKYPHLADQVCCFMDAVIAIKNGENDKKLANFLRYPPNGHVLDFLDQELPKLEAIIKIGQQPPISKILADSIKKGALASPLASTQEAVSKVENPKREF